MADGCRENIQAAKLGRVFHQPWDCGLHSLLKNERAVLAGVEKGINMLNLREQLAKRLVFLITDVGLDNHLGP